MNSAPASRTRDYRLADLAQALGLKHRGDGSIRLCGAGTLDDVQPGFLVRIEGKKYLDAALASPAAAWIVPPDLELPPEAPPCLLAAQPRLAFARCLRLFHPEPPLTPGVHPSTVLEADVELGEGCQIGPLAYLGPGVRLGRGVQVAPQASLEAGVEVGDGCFVGPGVHAYSGVRLGSNVRVHAGVVLGSDGFSYEWDGEQWVKIPHVGGLRIEADVEIGANSTIDRGTVGDTVIGRGTKIDCLVQIGHNVQIGEGCMIVSQVGISGSARLGRGVVLAGQVGVNPGVTIGDGCRVGGQAGVWGDLPAGSVVSGNPARPHREQLRIQAALAKLPDLLRWARRRRQE